ncbi:hypothetical protein BYT27DRAFT_7336357 [Phlegmacium glaucopus]|nr:hypothetical protein BYT27DRAFT_7336357 [Phlegmacium glaucopus]
MARNNTGLPLEVIGLIIDIVATHTNSDSSLKACALVCRSMLPLCRDYIFATVTLNDPYSRHPSPTTDDLTLLLSNSPHLAMHIRELKYYVKEAKNTKFVAGTMFKKLVRLRTLSISYLVAGSTLNWLSVPQLLPLLHLPTLTSISLSEIRNFALANLAGCVNLKKLRIESVGFSTDVGDVLEVLPTTPMLGHLEGNAKPVQRLCHARRPDGTPIINIKIIVAKAARLDSMKELFGICRNLRVAHLSARSPDPSSLDGLFTLLRPSLPTLVNIHIETCIHIIDKACDHFSCLCHVPSLCRELQAMVGQNTVKTIKLVIRGVQVGYDCRQWGKLDKILMGSPEGWPALRKVSLEVDVKKFCGPYFDDGETTIKKLLLTQLTMLVESKKVKFRCHVD